MPGPAMLARCIAAAERNTVRVRQLHALRYGCESWEAWTEWDVPLMEGGRSDIAFVGCRAHSVKVAT